MKNRVVLLRSNPVSPDPPVEKMADTLLANGYEVIVVGWDRGSNELEKVDTLYLERGQAKVVRFGIPAVFDGGIKKNFLPLAKFQKTLYKWLKNHKDEYDIIHAFDFDTGFIASKIVKKHNKSLIYHVLDFYVDSHRIPTNYLCDKIKKAELSIINNAGTVIICTEKRVEQIAGSNPRKLVIIHNTPKAIASIDDGFIQNTQKDRVKIAYVGILAGSRFIREIIKFVELNEQFEFHIGGFGIMEKEIANAADRCDRIIFYGKLPYDKTLSLEKSCDIMTAIYDPKVPNHKFAAPNKFYESLMLGKPVVMARGTGFDEIIEKCNIGCLIEFSEKGFSDGLNKLLSQRDEWSEMSSRMKQLYNEQYSWLEMERRIVDLYSDLKGSN